MINLLEFSISKKKIYLFIKVLYSKNLVDNFFQNSAEKLIQKIIQTKHIALTQSCSSALEVASILIYLKKIFSCFHYIPFYSSFFSRKNLKSKQKSSITECFLDRFVRVPLHLNLSIKQVGNIIKSVKFFFKIYNYKNI